MDERDFVSQKRQTWEQLAGLITKANGRHGVRNLSRDDLLALGPLYRRVSSDLAYARAHATSPDLVQHLNGLVGQAHALLYEAETTGHPLRSLLQFYGQEFPALLQRHFRHFFAAVLVTMMGAAFAYILLIRDPSLESVFIPAQFKSSMEAWKSGEMASEAHAEFSGQLFVNNQNVGLIAFAGGVAAGIPTAGLLFNNGVILGAASALMTQSHRHSTFWPGILPHGIAELTAIFICGAAGFRLGLAVLFPGPWQRMEALRLAALDAIRLALGTIPLFVFAGIIEGMFSHLPISASIRYGFAALNGTLWYLYLFLPRVRTEGSRQ